METFFDISLESLNLFSFMMGVSFVALSSMWGGRLRATRISFFYLAGLLVWVGVIKPNMSTPIFNKGDSSYSASPKNTTTPSTRKTQ